MTIEVKQPEAAQEQAQNQLESLFENEEFVIDAKFKGCAIDKPPAMSDYLRREPGQAVVSEIKEVSYEDDQIS